MARQNWLDKSADVLLDELDALGMIMSREHAQALISERLSHVAGAMGISEMSARTYLNEDAVRDLARRSALSVVEEQPGADTLTLARDSVVPAPLIGRTIAGLAAAMRVHLDNETPASAAERVLAIAGELSAAGQILADTPASIPGIAFPRALLLRMVRYLDVAGQILDGGGTVEALDAAGLAQLAAAFHDNSAELKAATR